MWDRLDVTGLVGTDRHCRYIIVVAASNEALYRDLEARFAGDARTLVVLDRRRRLDTAAGAPAPPVIERRLTHPTQISSLGVAVIRLAEDPPAKGRPVHEPAGRGARKTMEGIEGLDDRQRVDRWLEESQYLIGRMLPAYLEDRDRVRTRLETVERDNERLRFELADARREIAELRADLELHRIERARIADSFHTIVDHLAALHGPVGDISSRLQNTPPGAPEVKAA
jgi:hypothetical protein